MLPSLNELQQEIAQGRDDPVYFSKVLLGVTPHKKQEEWLKKSHQKINVLVPGNRFGKTVVTAVKHIWKCFYKKGIPTGDMEKWGKAQYRTCNLSPHSQQMRQCYEYIIQILKGNFKVGMGYNKCKIGWFLKSEQILPYLVINFFNDSAFTARPTAGDQADSIQGGSYNYISYDECCLSNHLREEVSAKILPRLLDTGGYLDLVSTPDRVSPSLLEFEDFYRNGLEYKRGFYSLSGSQLDNPYLSRKEIERTSIVQEEAGDVEQTRDGKFVFPGSSYFPKDAIDNIFTRIQFTKVPYIDGHQYITGVDLARSEDYTVIITLDITSDSRYQIVDFQRFKGAEVPTQSQIGIIRDTSREYHVVDTILDASGLGGLMADDLLEGIDHTGFDFKPQSKKEAIGDLRSAIVSNQNTKTKWGKIYSNLIIPLRDELFKYRLEDDRLRQDCVMSLALAVHGALQYAPPEEPLNYVDTL